MANVCVYTLFRVVSRCSLTPDKDPFLWMLLRAASAVKFTAGMGNCAAGMEGGTRGNLLTVAD